MRITVLVSKSHFKLLPYQITIIVSNNHFKILLCRIWNKLPIVSEVDERIRYIADVWVPHDRWNCCCGAAVHALRSGAELGSKSWVQSWDRDQGLECIWFRNLNHRHYLNHQHHVVPEVLGANQYHSAVPILNHHHYLNQHRVISEVLGANHYHSAVPIPAGLSSSSLLLGACTFFYGEIDGGG